MPPLGRAKSGRAACMPHPVPMLARNAICFDNRAGDSVLRGIFKVSGRDIRLKAKGYLCDLSGSPQKPRFAEGQVEPASRDRRALQQGLDCDGGHAETTHLRVQHPAAIVAASHLLRTIGPFDRGINCDWLPPDSLRGGHHPDIDLLSLDQSQREDSPRETYLVPLGKEKRGEDLDARSRPLVPRCGGCQFKAFLAMLETVFHAASSPASTSPSSSRPLIAALTPRALVAGGLA